MAECGAIDGNNHRCRSIPDYDRKRACLHIREREANPSRAAEAREGGFRKESNPMLVMETSPCVNIIDRFGIRDIYYYYGPGA